MFGVSTFSGQDHSDDGHIPEFDDFHAGLWGCTCFVWCIEALHL